jgi:hypothetical protein
MHLWLDGGEWSASRPGRFTPRERAHGTHRIGGWHIQIFAESLRHNVAIFLVCLYPNNVCVLLSGEYVSH